jgi:hypothetical protein
MRLSLLIVPVAAALGGGLVPQAAAQARGQVEETIPRARNNSDALRGLKGFWVLIGVGDVPVDTTTIRNRVELKLRQNGIRIGPDEAAALTLQCVAVAADKPGISGYSCWLGVHQLVVRTSPSPLRLDAETWRTRPHVSTVGSYNLRDSMARNIDVLCDEFLNDWFKANPR